MTLKRTTLFAAIGISYTFALRAIGTFLPDIFRNLQVAQVITIISLLASLTFVLFFFCFYRDYVQEEQSNLRKASVLAIIGTSAVTLLQIKGLFLVFKKALMHIYNISPHLVGLIRSRHVIVPIVPWVSSIFILLFFVVFRREALRKDQVKLSKAILFAIVGSSIGTSLRTIVLFHYLYSREVRWFADLSRTIQIIFVPITAFGFIAVFYFLLTFYKEQKGKG